MDLSELREPIVQAPLAGGASTPRLAAAVNEAGGLGFLAAGYKTADAIRGDIHELRSLTSEPFGVNIFAPPAPQVDGGARERYAASLRAEADRYGVELGESRHDDDFAAKVALVVAERVEIVSFTFGCPPREVVARLREAGCDVWVTVTNPDEAVQAQTAGAGALIVQGTDRLSGRPSPDHADPCRGSGGRRPAGGQPLGRPGVSAGAGSAGRRSRAPPRRGGTRRRQQARPKARSVKPTGRWNRFGPRSRE